MEAIERIRGFACEVNERQWKTLVKTADKYHLEIGVISRSAGTFDGLFKFAYAYSTTIGCYESLNGRKLIPFEEFLAKLKGEQPQQTTPFAEQVAANIIKISCNKDTHYADKMKMVVQAILEFERDPKNQQPKNEKA